MPPSKWLRDQLVPLVPLSTPPASLPYRLSTPANIADSTISTALIQYDSVKEICAKRAIAIVLESQLNSQKTQEWWMFARKFNAEATSLFRATKFEIDLSNPQTGYASIVINGGSSNMR